MVHLNDHFAQPLYQIQGLFGRLMQTTTGGIIRRGVNFGRANIFWGGVWNCSFEMKEEIGLRPLAVAS